MYGSGEICEELFASIITAMKKYHPSDDFSLVEKAYDVAVKAHSGQFRKSGEPYIIHPLSVALILAETELDMETISAGILHDVIEDSENFDKKYIADNFGKDVAELVDGVTKLDKYKNVYVSAEEQQAENLRKMFLAMASDIRVILIKIADRLHNMRTLKYQAEGKQKSIALETLEIYCPLADRMGISKLRYELEDISFKYIDPEAYADLKDKIQLKQSERIAHVEKIVEQLRGALADNNVECHVEGRPKHFFSIYKKMRKQDKTLDQIFDLFAVRVITNSIRDCYAALGVAHELYHQVAGRFKDYIAMPKPNMYQSLHNTLIDSGGEPFELQIRTWAMHRACEFGIAAHWKYKSGKDGKADKGLEEAKLEWLQQILAWQNDSFDNKEFLEVLKSDLNVFKGSIFCFTPKGRVINLAAGATPIDFAYAIHSAVGNKMVGVKINGRIANIDSQIESGDIVEILTSQNSQGPNLDWLKIVKTSQARTKINQWFKKENRDDNIAKGKDLLEKGAKKKNLALSELITPKGVEAVISRFAYSDWEGICAAVGYGGIRENSVIEKLYEEYLIGKGVDIESEKLTRQLLELEKSGGGVRREHTGKRSGIVVKGVGDINVRMSKCCSPVPGDEIVGFVTRGRGVSIHRTDCANILNLDDLEKQRLIDSTWEIPAKNPGGFLFRGDIRLECADRFGLLVDISRACQEEKVEVTGLTVKSDKNLAVYDISLAVTSKEQMEKIMARLLGVKDVLKAERLRV